MGSVVAISFLALAIDVISFVDESPFLLLIALALSAGGAAIAASMFSQKGGVGLGAVLSVGLLCGGFSAALDFAKIV